MKDILKEKYPAKAHIKSVLSYLQTFLSSSPATSSSSCLASDLLAQYIIYIPGTASEAYDDTDSEVPFRQSRHFFYVTGCNLPDCSYTYDVGAGKSTLYLPAPPSARTQVYNGPSLTPSAAKELYDVDDVQIRTELDALLATSPHIMALTSATTISKDWPILTLQSLVPIHHAGIKQPAVPILKLAIDAARLTKSPYEVALIREANRISSLAHEAVMRGARHARNERELKAVFVGECIRHGADEQAYGPIVAAGESGATLHYMSDSAEITDEMRNLLVDASGEFRCYASDITRTFPLKGQFDEESRAVYEIVLEMQKTCIGMLKAGVDYPGEVNDVAHSIMVDGLLKLGILRGKKEEILENGIDYLFLMHGLGHYIGLETHDVGGPRKPAAKSAMLLPHQRRGVSEVEALHHEIIVNAVSAGGLPAGSVITVEPGIYINRLLLGPALEDDKVKKFIDKDVLDKYWKVGGVRIEDCVLITESGYDNLTTAPKEIDELEAITSRKAGNEWQFVDIKHDVSVQAGMMANIQISF